MSGHPLFFRITKRYLFYFQRYAFHFLPVSTIKSSEQSFQKSKKPRRITIAAA